jgi:hypothetical protein
VSKLVIYEDEDFQKPNEGAQQQFMDDYTHFFCAFAGGWYSGKTWAGGRKLADQHVFNALDDGQPTYVRSLCVAQTFPLARTQNIPELQTAFDEMGLSYRFVADPKRYCFEMHDFGTKAHPSEILVRSAESPDTINAFTVGVAWGDEAARWPEDRENPKNDPMTQVLGRIRDPKAKVLQLNLTFTHEGDMTRVYEDYEEKPKKDHILYRAETTENPHALDFAKRVGEQLPPDLALQYLSGYAMKTRGMAIYPPFDREVHVDDDEPIVVTRLKRYLPLQLTLDFNIAPGMHGILGQYDPIADHFTARHEIHAENMAVPDLFHVVQKLLADHKWEKGKDWRWGGGRLEIFGDASGGNEHASRGESCWDVVQEMCNVKGIPHTLKIPGANPRIADRVHSVCMAMKDGRGRSHYTIHPSCEKLIRDYKKMKWTLEGDIDKKDKKMSHPSDAEGYRIWFQRPIKAPRPTNNIYQTEAVSAR